MVSIGVVESSRTIVLNAPGPSRLMLNEQGLPKTIYSDTGARYFFSVDSSIPAKRRWWARVAIFDENEVQAAQRAKTAWARSNLDVRIELVGSLLSLGGAVLDTRSQELLVGGFEGREDAKKYADRLFQERGIRAVVRPTLEEQPQGAIEVVISNADEIRRRHVGAGAIYLGTTVGGLLEHEGRTYPEHLYVVIGSEGTLALVHSVDAETLLRGLVPAEIFASAPPASLEAQAIVARGAILSLLGHRHFDEPFHLCDEQHCQVYKGAGAAHPATDAAVARTRGRLAVRPREDASEPVELVESVYSSSCGGHTEGNEIVWDQPPSESLRPRLDGPKDDRSLDDFRSGINDRNLSAWLEAFPPTYCARSRLAQANRFRWKKTLGPLEIKAVGRKLGVGAIREVKILGRGSGGRVTGVKVIGLSGEADVLRELPVRRVFNQLRSGAFIIETEKDDKGMVSQLTFRGAGWGHGVGLCQLGAIGRAEAGQAANEILRFYYSGAVVERFYD